MRPKQSQIHSDDTDLFQPGLNQIVDMNHALIILAKKIDWGVFEETLNPLYSTKKGAPALPTRLLVGLHYLKYAYDESDESIVDRWIENPYWQYFCGYKYFQHACPLHPTSLVKWRNRIGKDGVELMLQETIQTAIRAKFIKKSDVKKVNIDTTVQEKNIAFPTDAKLYHTMREKLVEAAVERGINLRQSFCRVSKKLLLKQYQASRSKKYKMSRMCTKKIKSRLGRVVRDIERKEKNPDKALFLLLAKANRLLLQEKKSKNKLYSIHEPDVECIAKGKVHKKYEFGNKVSLVTTSRNNWIIGALAFHGNPFDGDTMKPSLEQAERLTGMSTADVYTDRGYRGRKRTIPNQTQHIVGERRAKKDKLSRRERRWHKRRNAIEPVIGHCKSDNRMKRNFLSGKLGDHNNAMMSACGFNFRKLLKAFFLPYFLYRFLQKIISMVDRIIKYANNFQPKQPRYS